MKNILISGASGLIGSALAKELTDSGHCVYTLDRKNPDSPFFYDQANGEIHLSNEILLDAVINLAGASIADGRWTRKRKQLIWESRVRTTQLLSEALSNLNKPPEVMLSASAIGFYGNNADSPVDESAESADDFLAKLSVAWESATDTAAEAGIRVVRLRFGLVLDADGGVLENLVMPLKLAVVGKIGNGQHFQSWISLRDALTIMQQCIGNQAFAGPINLVAPEVVSNGDFAKTLSKALKRPQLPPMPAPIVRIVFGEMADAALLASANIRSTRMSELGIELKYPTLASALENIYSR